MSGRTYRGKDLDVNFRQMEVFHAIMMTGSVTSAAKSLNITQPAATKILRHSEDQLKFRLFHRVKGRLVPTDDALAILPEVERVLQDMRAVHQSLDDVRSARRGSLSIVAIPTLGQVVLPRAIALFARERPEVPVSFEIRAKRYVMQSVATQRAEVGFAFLTPTHSGVETKPLCSGRLVCIVRRDHRLASRTSVTASDLAGESFIAFSKEQGLRPLVESALVNSRIQFSGQIETGWVSTAWTLVDNGIGISLVDSISQLDRLYHNVVAIPLLPDLPVQADVLIPRAKPLSRIARHFVDLASKVLSEDQGKTPAGAPMP